MGNTGANAVQTIDKVLKYLRRQDDLKANPEVDQRCSEQANSSWGLDDSISLQLGDVDESSSADDSNTVGSSDGFFFGSP
jgi:hypothetical protein